jgi:hypothetical protein
MSLMYSSSIVSSSFSFELLLLSDSILLEPKSWFMNIMFEGCWSEIDNETEYSPLSLNFIISPECEHT